MARTVKTPLIPSTPEIRIVGLNTDKTRKTLGSYTAYQVYFALSDTPPSAWGEIFGREWKDLNQTQEAILDGKFLVLHSPLPEVGPTHLPALKKAVHATNLAYSQYAREQATDRARKGDASQQERDTVEAMAHSLRFE